MGNIQEAISKYEDATKILYGNTARLYPLAYAKWGFALAEQARRSVNPVGDENIVIGLSRDPLSTDLILPVPRLEKDASGI